MRHNLTSVSTELAGNKFKKTFDDSTQCLNTNPKLLSDENNSSCCTRNGLSSSESGSR